MYALLAQIRIIKNFGHPEYIGHTTVNPIGLAALVIMGITLLLVRRRYAIWPILVMACFIAPAQRIVVFTVDFNFLRLMVLFGFIRLIVKQEYKHFHWKTLDSIVLVWGFVGTVCNALQVAQFSAIIYNGGIFFDSMGMYFLFRCLIRNWEDINAVIWGCILISIPVSLAFLHEQFTRRNLFAVFGGVPAITAMREGRLRCQGAFAHPILAGCFWASLLPLFFVYGFRNNKAKYWAMVGIIDALSIIVMSSSSTPVMGVMAGIIGGLLFYFRPYMRIVRWGVICLLVILHMVMKGPVWALVAKVSAVGGSTGWHRYRLIDQAIKHFGEWWLVGTNSTAHWGWGLQDVTNQYIAEGTRGGFMTLILFVMIIAMAYKYIGRTCRLYKHKRYYLIFSWALGVSLFVHCCCFIGVSYFGQIIVIWYLLLAMIGSISVSPMEKRSVMQSVKIKRRSSKNKSIRKQDIIQSDVPKDFVPG